jgi:hypothetical protein
MATPTKFWESVEGFEPTPEPEPELPSSASPEPHKNDAAQQHWLEPVRKQNKYLVLL